MSNLEYLDHLPPGWFPLNVFPEEEDDGRNQSWLALMVDVDPDELKYHEVDYPALFFVHPDEYRPGFRKAHQRWFRIQGKYKNADLAWDTLMELMEPRH